ncbi:putative SWIM-type domain-containing protein [Phytophthora infestans]|uniref:Putative SWIM-type domain-containing protein n=1 Tax=Phytophthora infestans TaxID=4787 RepID=A0A8S9TP65_PHYIN|nr:putative SWIM-type domain-containing protein [Phytophthora infestans]
MPNATPWSHEEDIRLCRAYTNIIEDGCISTDQDATHFWDRVHQTYSQLGEDSATKRKTGALQSLWAGLIRPDVALYASCVALVQDEAHSGWTDSEYLDEAGNRFTAKYILQKRL